MTFSTPKLRQWAASRPAMGIALAWGLMEATFFFVVPDVLFSLTSLLFPLFGILHACLSVVGSVIGGIIMYAIAYSHPLESYRFLLSVPGIPPEMAAQVYEQLQERGLTALFAAPWSGIPYKIYAACAGILKLNLTQLVLVTIPSRLQRILLISIFAGLLGKAFKKSIEKHTKIWILCYCIFWIVFYGFYAYSIGSRY